MPLFVCRSMSRDGSHEREKKTKFGLETSEVKYIQEDAISSTIVPLKKTISTAVSIVVKEGARSAVTGVI